MKIVERSLFCIIARLVEHRSITAEHRVIFGNLNFTRLGGTPRWKSPSSISSHELTIRRMNLSRRRFFIYTSFPLRCTAASIFTGAAVCRSIFIVLQEAKGKKEYRRGGRDARELFYILSSDIEFACKCMIMRGNRGEGRFSRVGEGSGEMRGYRRENGRGE